MTIYLVRHAQSKFNAIFDPDEPDPMIFDAPITSLGESQARQARNEISQLDVSRVIVSPLTRALQTAQLIFDGQIQFQVDPIVRERLCHSCDVGRPPQALRSVFPRFNFDHLESCWWHDGEKGDKGISVEPQASLERRAGVFVDYLKRERVHSTAVVTHGRFIRALTGSQVKNCEVIKFEPY